MKLGLAADVCESGTAVDLSRSQLRFFVRWGGGLGSLGLRV